MPLVKVDAFTLLGDLKVYSLSQVPEGRLRAWWKKVRAKHNDGPAPKA